MLNSLKNRTLQNIRSLAANLLPQNQRRFEEIGTTGLEEWSGWIQEAYRTELQWPGVEAEYSRIWRSDPELTIQRNFYGSWASTLTPRFELPPTSDIGEDSETTDDDKAALEFANQVLVDIEDGITAWLVSTVTRTPFYGFGWWEAPPGIRNENWKPPKKDPWRSKYNDGLVGYRRLAFRRYSSFYKWIFDDETDRMIGFKQMTATGGFESIPLNRSLHTTFGDSDNPEGLATLESMWRLQRIHQGLEIVFGIGAEHTAGHLSVTVDDEKSFNIDNIKRAASALMTAQEGNYAAWPHGVSGELIDVPFAAGETILNAIRHYTVLKLALLGMQWVAFSTISGVGSMASMKDASQMAITIFNSIVAGQVQQADQQIGKRLFEYDVNKAAFPNMTRRPVLTVDKLKKDIDLAELGSFATALNAIMPLGDDDFVAIRRASEVLPEALPEALPELQVSGDDEIEDVEEPTSEPEPVTPEEAEEIVEEVIETARVHRPDLYAMLDNEVETEQDCADC